MILASGTYPVGMQVRRCQTTADWDAATRLVGDYLLTFDPEPSWQLNQFNQDLLARLEETFSQSGAAMFLATTEGLAVGCSGVIPHDGPSGEVKRLYVSSAARRRGVGSRLLAECVRFAGQFGYQRLVLDVVVKRRPAMALYKQHGWTPIPQWEGRGDMAAYELLLPIPNASCGG